MKINNYVIAFDLDGVLFDFEGAFCESFGYENRHLVDLHKRYPEVDPELIDEFIKSPSTYKNLSPILGGFAFVQLAQSLGFGIIFLSSRPYTTTRETQDALATYGLDASHLCFTKDKAEFIDLFNRSGNQKIRMLVDDIPSNLEKLPTGVVGMCWEQPWNEGKYPRARYSQNMTVVYKSDTVSDWKEIFKEIK